jgi:hypothetical protein
MNHAVLDEVRVGCPAPCPCCGANTGQPCQPDCSIAAIQAKLAARWLYVPCDSSWLPSAGSGGSLSRWTPRGVFTASRHR